MRGFVILSCVLWGGFLVSSEVEAVVHEVRATVETEPVPHSGDRADDATIWVHPSEPGKSVVIGTDKDASEGGLVLYDLSGRQLQFVGGGKMNNVDVRYNINLGGDLVDIVATGNRTDNTIAIYRMDAETRMLTDVTARKIAIGIEEAYGFCLYRSRKTQKLYAFVNDKNGEVEQLELFDDGSGRIDGASVRRFDVGTQTEGMTADDELGFVYVGEEDVGIWKYGAEPNAPSGVGDRYQVDTTGEGGHIAADVEGLTIYHARGGRGYLIASSQGEGSAGHPLTDTFSIYERGGDNVFVMSVRIAGNSELGIDGVGNTDGVCVTNAYLGAEFSYGVFVAQDGTNTGGNQNFKLVPWESIANVIEPNLEIDTDWDPRVNCGSSGYMEADLSRDCRVDFEDMGILASGWTDYDKLALLASQWLNCNLDPPSACTW
jgi:3-phytase